MCASGLEEVLSIMYGSNTVQHVLSGKAYVHFLVHGALTYTVSQKRQDTKLLPITLPNIGRFSKFFHY